MRATVCKMAGLLPLPILLSVPLYYCSDDTDDTVRKFIDFMEK